MDCDKKYISVAMGVFWGDIIKVGRWVINWEAAGATDLGYLLAIDIITIHTTEDIG